MRLFVSNLPLKTRDHDLRRLFSPYGRVVKAWIVEDETTRESRGFGFVEMDLVDARDAMRELDRSWFQESRIYVQKSRFMPSRRRESTEPFKRPEQDAPREYQSQESNSGS
ncbi:RNA-binding protein [bacterium (Candidatus Blackallbacteria) CG17_big_fil_post_rev_8_21_14_2_50_48_46]|uniref:RNA-binding protein n=1 Tax=bacterium (Candidatus Blackallbacteria) CG17_big_fil_post_rev_8_21_14_2_50_48_46 TaxID=2014261 RepID=A0A2M7G5R1_9BACT|nr:MAG: RNA-binding protein [bacterium (Candidatus Blackallbacteria) CG18_big_fil_WC_8_21_14_2_50_49_26]PIW17243.1 MAG: RNA-binding protein [bacterium (Candidatus Blackallbacteria) CG17_big_fil_post_rev_8_21_14_2_50_48_46]PIW51035.1 MAG: RNA-binding protein [bacterium (Candidatus Blackallbacteria) CG13_big_fil_rev_8_21_14_2_50_49_14]